jgi:hypothetical protein
MMAKIAFVGIDAVLFGSRNGGRERRRARITSKIG